MSTVGGTIVTKSAGDPQVITVPSASPGSRHAEQARRQSKTPLPKAGGEAEGGLAELSRLSQPPESQEDG